ncbi:hypothetical protein [Sphingomonas endolithica]|uniref:hypothetical protein n=1 Tax=Sphingomonas endolithica TaxID=2972485 RepID=UPI0021AF8C69|nr:hypothetical protein [Sphingomonas sp. ZFBP2030]
MTTDPDNSHVMPMLALHLGGLMMAVMGAAGLYFTVFKGMRVLDRNTGGNWPLLETLLLEIGLLLAGGVAAWWGQRPPR